jgi:RNA polymerase sigma-70 factor, ECF subfamily
MEFPEPTPRMVGAVRPVTRGMAAGIAALLLAPLRIDDPTDASPAAGDDLSAIEVLYDRYAGIVFSLALRIVRERPLAEEILEEVFFRAWQWAQEPNPLRGTVLSWLVEMTRAMAIEAAFDRRPAAERSETEDAGVAAEAGAWTGDTQRAVAAALTELPPEQRQAIELAYFEGLPDGEIAELLGVSVERVRAWLRQATEAIRKAVGNAHHS